MRRCLMQISILFADGVHSAFANINKTLLVFVYIVELRILNEPWPVATVLIQFSFTCFLTSKILLVPLGTQYTARFGQLGVSSRPATMRRGRQCWRQRSPFFVASLPQLVASAYLSLTLRGGLTVLSHPVAALCPRLALLLSTFFFTIYKWNKESPRFLHFSF